MPASKFRIERKCEFCGNTFLAKTVYSKYCSHKCSCAAHDKKVRDEKKELQRQAVASKVPKDRPYITIPEAVALFGISRDTIYRLVRNGTIPAVNLGERLTRISRAHIEAFFPDVVPATKASEIPVPQKSYKFDSSDSYTIGEVSKKYAISDSTVYKTIRKMSIPTCQKGKFVYVPKAEIDRYFKPIK